jgi:hypothetical protein
MVQPESRLSREIMTAARARGAFAWKNHGGPTMMAGLPDIAMCYRGMFVSMETKMPGGVVSAVQALRHTQIRAAGGLAPVVRSVKEAMAVLDGVDRMLDFSDAPAI